MARSRTIKPGFFRNEVLGECAPEVRLLFAGLWCAADRRGILEDRPKRIKADWLPWDTTDVDAALNELQEKGFIERYSIGETRCIRIVKFCEHQNPHRDERASTLPAPGEHHASTVVEPGSNQADTVPAPGEHRANTVPAPCEHRADTVQAPSEHGSSTAITYNLVSLTSSPDRERQTNNALARDEMAVMGVAVTLPEDVQRAVEAEAERRKAAFDALYGAMGVTEASPTYLARWNGEAHELTGKILDTTTPEKLAGCAAWLLAAWKRDGIDNTPRIRNVLDGMAAWERAGCPDPEALPAKPRNRGKPSGPSAPPIANRNRLPADAGVERFVNRGKKP